MPICSFSYLQSLHEQKIVPYGTQITKQYSQNVPRSVTTTSNRFTQCNLFKTKPTAHFRENFCQRLGFKLNLSQISLYNHVLIQPPGITLLFEDFSWNSGRFEKAKFEIINWPRKPQYKGNVPACEHLYFRTYWFRWLQDRVKRFTQKVCCSVTTAKFPSLIFAKRKHNTYAPTWDILSQKRENVFATCSPLQ